MGIGKLEEKDVNLKIAGYLAEYLKKEGYETVMTRESDKGLYEEDSRNKKVQDMQNRCALIKKQSLFSQSVSIRTAIRTSLCAVLRCSIIPVL